MNRPDIHSYFTIGSVAISHQFLSRILSGVHFSKFDSSSAQFTNLTLCENNSWLEDKHFDCFTYLLELQNYRTHDHQDSSIPVIIDPHFYPTLLFDTEKALFLVRQKLSKFKLLNEQNCCTTTLLFPISLNSHHWILAYFNCSACSYWMFDPLSPTKPNQEQVEIAQLISEQLQNEFGLPTFSMNMPELPTTFPTQNDEHNCGAYVLWYLFLLL